MMRLRSLLFAPGDRPERMEKAQATDADAVIFDLEDSVAPSGKAAARGTVAAALGARGKVPARFVRVNPIGTGLTGDDLAAVVPAQPDGIMLPKAEGAASMHELDRLLRAEEARCGLPIGGIKALPIATETARAMFKLGEYADAAERLVGLTWGAEDLPVSLGAIAAREADGRYTPPYEVARAFTLFAAAAAGVAPIETVYPAFKDLDGLAAYAARGARDGFTGMMAIHPSQVPVINAAFTPTAEAVAEARAVVEAFAANPGVGAISLDGKMIDAPHLARARRILERA